MNTSSEPLLSEANAPLAHIFLSLDLLESNTHNEDNKTYLSIIRQNTERLQNLIRNIENYKIEKKGGNFYHGGL
ncbi:MAG TPA: histidine kinase dimerization/phospho-acceptor domain-containing protein [Puia sp.]|nr:histidine kinase dimerization/phospho-acceptor domain-containing protein [Puia sp.]